MSQTLIVIRPEDVPPNRGLPKLVNQAVVELWHALHRKPTPGRLYAVTIDLREIDYNEIRDLPAPEEILT